MESSEKKKPKPKGDPEINAIRNIDRILSAFEFSARLDILDFIRGRVMRRHGEQLQLQLGPAAAATAGALGEPVAALKHNGEIVSGQLFP